MVDTPQEAPTRRILALDGGGVRGLLSIKLLESLEARIKSSSYDIRNSAGQRPKRLLDLFDMVAGTSTGAIIVGLLQMGLSPTEVLEKYRSLIPQVFKARRFNNLTQLFGPKYSRGNLRQSGYELFGDTMLWQLPKDTMIVARDMIRSESTFFTAFRLSESEPVESAQQVYGTYKSLRLRDAILASASAPTYFPPHGRFVDGGVGNFNNPCLQAPIEALGYSAPSQWELWQSRHPGEPTPPGMKTWQRDIRRYQPGRVIVYSFGTGHGKRQRSIREIAAMKLLSWIGSITGELMGDINEQQSRIASGYINVVRGNMPNDVLTPLFRLHRYQLYFTREGVKDIGGTWEDGMAGIRMDQVESMDLLERLGDQMGEKITEQGLWDEEDLSDSLQPDTRARRVPGNVFVEFGRPAFDFDYAHEIIAEFERSG